MKRVCGIAILLCGAAVGVAHAGAIIIDHDCIDLSVIPEDSVTAAASLRLLMRHASVGQGIGWGLDCLAGLKPTNASCQCFAPGVYDRTNWVLEARMGDGCSKIDDLVAQTSARADEFDVLTMKYCYIDALGDNHPDWEYYRTQMEQLEAQYPDKRFVWWTIPLTRDGQPGTDAFNALVRSYCAANGKTLFDIADIECHDPSGVKQTNAQGDETICQDYTKEIHAGHLNVEGRIRVASALWRLMAAIADDEPPVPDPHTIIHVDDDANAPGDGSSWETAYKFLQDALADAESAERPVEIRVAQGIYRPDQGVAFSPWAVRRQASFRLLDQVMIRGGFAGSGAPDPNARDVERFATVLSGDLAGNDVELADPLEAQEDASRAENCYHVVSYDSRGFPEELTAEMDGFVITGGRAFYVKRPGEPNIATPPEHCGGGLYILASKATAMITLRDCRFEWNYAEEIGGAVYCSRTSHVYLEGCTLSANASQDDGGALYTEGEMQLFRCCLHGNRGGVRSSGGAALLSGRVALVGCTISQNEAGFGGGLYCSGETFKLIDCILSDNVALESGGAIYFPHGDLVAERCTFSNNKANWGGAMSLPTLRAKAEVHNNLFAGNCAAEKGAVISTQYGEVNLVNCTIVGNRAPSGVFLCERTPVLTAPVPYGGVDVTNCIVSNGGDEIWNDHGAITIRFTNLLGSEAAVHDPHGMITWGQGNTDVDPLFADPGFWNPNGTPEDPNDDFFVEGDYHLKSRAGRWDVMARTWVLDEVTSPCIDTGDPNSPIDNEPEPNGGRINMGAYGGTVEASMSPLGG